MTGSVRIVGIMLVRNEDVFLPQAIANIVDFCDELVILDNLSIDSTAEIARTYEREHGHISFYTIKSPVESHAYIEKYAGTKTWVFGVDGDEIYDPDGLRRLRKQLLDNEYIEWWQVFGNVLNCVDIDYESMRGHGYLAPPCRSITKLFNFAAIDEWNGDCPERLHGGLRKYREGYGDNSRLNLQERAKWEDADLRCLHVCFMRRSSTDRGVRKVRENIVEVNQRMARSMLWRLTGGRVAAMRGGRYKRTKYMRGDPVHKDVAPFFVRTVPNT